MGVDTERTTYIDGLRAIAVLGVVASHALPAWYFGAHGVELFFVLSGFCLSYPTLKRLRAAGKARFDVARFAAHRITRIVPPYWAAIALLLSVIGITRALHVPLPHGLNPASAMDILRQSLFLDRHTTFLTGPFWTLSVELRWYVFFPIALYLWVRAPRALLLLCLVGEISPATGLFSTDAVCLPAFLLGIVAADIQIQGLRIARFALPVAVAMVAAGVLIERPPAPAASAYISPPFYLGMFALVVAAGSTPLLARALSVRILSLIGVASYSIYLVHSPAIGFAKLFGLSPLAAAITGVFAGIAFWYVVERPLLSHRVRQRMITELSVPVMRWLVRVQIFTAVLLAPQTPASVTVIAMVEEAPRQVAAAQ
jgi:peptidoglycan/LPS O-acetylase OafA/YrhL